jgi:Protein of unknown function (DUF4229)
VKAFAIYTVLRLALFVVVYAVLGAAYALVFGKSGALFYPFVAAVLISSVLSLKLLAPQRERFAQTVEARATRATANFEARRAREDVD